MTLTDGGKDWIAEHLGIGNCMTEVSRAFTYRDSVNNITIPDNGGTAKILNRLIDSSVPYVEIAGVPHRYTELKSANGNQDVIYPIDVQWVMANDSGASAYCVGTPTPAPPSSTLPTTGPIEVYVGEGDCPKGSPSVILDTTGAFAFYKDTPYKYIGVGGIKVLNQSTTCRAHFSWEVRVWDGYGYTTCPTTNPEMVEINRFLATAGSRPLSTTMLEAVENDVVWGSFEILPTMEGEKTICLSLWGNFSKVELIKELNGKGYFDR